MRYTGSAISYNVSSILGAAVAPFIAVALWGASGGSVLLVGIYLSAMAAITLVALFISKETRDREFHDNVELSDWVSSGHADRLPDRDA